MDDGLSKRMVRLQRGMEITAREEAEQEKMEGLKKHYLLPDGTTISESKWRQEALKAYGNAIVPQVAMKIMEGIKEIDNL